MKEGFSFIVDLDVGWTNSLQFGRFMISKTEIKQIFSLSF